MQELALPFPLARPRARFDMTPHAQPAPDFVSDEQRYGAVQQRDLRADGVFFYSVASTGVYCRPSCGARLPLRKNLGFHESAEAAERAGFRACKRCRPREPSEYERHAQLVLELRAQLESVEAPKTLQALSARAGLSPAHLQRLFKRHVGMSPREYAAAVRLQHVGDELREGTAVTSALYDAGYSSSGRFYEAESGALGVLPAELRRGARGVLIRALVLPSTLGLALVAASERGICAITFGDSEAGLLDELRARFPHAQLEAADGALEQLAARVLTMVEQSRFGEDVPLDLVGTLFQQRVWRELRKIPRGETRSYGELAAALGAPGAARAVGSACGNNPVAVLVPCHRVVRADRSPGGYRWGAARKQQLLKREQDE